MQQQPSSSARATQHLQNRKTGERTHGHALRGERTMQDTPFVQGERWTTIGAMSEEGMLGYGLFRDSANGADFLQFAREVLVSGLALWCAMASQTAGGILTCCGALQAPKPRSVVVADNASIHKSLEFQQIVEARGAKLLFLPPYSPDLNAVSLQQPALLACLAVLAPDTLCACR